MYLWLLISTVKSGLQSREKLIFENALLRYQLGVLKRRRRRIILRRWDRQILVWLSRRLLNWKDILFIVQPETLVRWHRRGFAWYWGRKYSRKSGRPEVHPKIIHLIRKICRANPLWGAPRIHGELLKLGINVSQSSVEKYMIKGRKPRGQSWKSFIDNHLKEVVAIDFFIVPTIRFRMLWALVVLSHDRRKILHTAVTHRPSGTWTTQQLRNAFALKEMPKILLHDRDKNFGGISRLGVRELVTAYRCPWQNAHVERLIGSIRRECTDHLIICGERHLERILRAYADYYNRFRTHLSLNKDSPISRPVRKDGGIVVTPLVGGLHQSFSRVA